LRRTQRSERVDFENLTRQLFQISPELARQFKATSMAEPKRDPDNK